MTTSIRNAVMCKQNAPIQLASLILNAKSAGASHGENFEKEAAKIPGFKQMWTGLANIGRTMAHGKPGSWGKSFKYLKDDVGKGAYNGIKDFAVKHPKTSMAVGGIGAYKLLGNNNSAPKYYNNYYGPGPRFY